MGREGYLSLCRAVKIFRRAVVIICDSEGGLSEIGEHDTVLSCTNMRSRMRESSMGATSSMGRFERDDESVQGDGRIRYLEDRGRRARMYSSDQGARGRRRCSSVVISRPGVSLNVQIRRRRTAQGKRAGRPCTDPSSHPSLQPPPPPPAPRSSPPSPQPP